MQHSHSWFSAAFRPQILVALLSMSLSASALAANEPAFEFTPFIGYRAGGQFKDGVTDATRGLDAKAHGALAINWRAGDPGTQYELTYSQQSTQTDDAASVKMKIAYLQIGGTTEIGDPEGRVMPFAVGGIGATRFSPSTTGLSDETRWGVNLGGGVRVPVAAHVRLRFEARGYLTYLGGDSNIFCDAGCVIVAKSKAFFQYEALAGVSVGF